MSTVLKQARSLAECASRDLDSAATMLDRANHPQLHGNLCAALVEVLDCIDRLNELVDAESGDLDG